MTNQYVSSVHIQKLGHKIQEIRERALLNIISKLDNGVLFDNDLARTKELLTNLFHWFLLEPCTMEDLVLDLLKRILKSDSGKTLITHCGRIAIKKEVTQIRSYIEPQYYPHLDELSKLIDVTELPIVPPLECDVPLSYRTGESNTNNNVFISSVDSTATPLEGHIMQDPSVEREMGVEKLSELYSLQDDLETFRLETGNIDINRVNNSLPNYFLQWQPLIDADMHVLQSVENSLKNPPQPLTLLHSCEFFMNVLLRDFPAEIFLQRSTIVLEFYSLLTCGSVRITNSVLRCLYNLTKALSTRINQCNDFCMRHSKTNLLPQLISACNTPTSNANRNSDNEDVLSNISEKFERPEDVVVLKKKQLSVPKYCLMTVCAVFKYMCVKHDTFRENKVKTNQVGVNLCLTLLDELLYLLHLSVKKDIWDRPHNETILTVLRGLNDILVQYGEALEYFRLESISCETLTFRVIYLYLLHNSTNLLKRFIPRTKTGLILPRNLKNALSNSLLDVTLGRLYPEVHNTILDYVQSYCVGSDVDHLKKYKDVKKVCQGMTATVKFSKEHTSLGTFDNLKLVKTAIPSLEFHKEFDFLKAVVDVCSEKLTTESASEIIDTAEEVMLNLLSHCLVEVKEEMYRLCQQKVIANIGPKLNMSSTGASGSHVLFLLTSRILTEISVFGMTDENLEIRRYAEDILTYILKCKILVCDSVYNKVVEALIPALPIIICHAVKTLPFGKAVINLTDPDTATNNRIPLIVTLKCNIGLLFSNDTYLREEAFSRICWLLSIQENSREMLPKFNTLFDTVLTNVFRFNRVIDINKVRHTEHFYQPSSLKQVMDLLKSQNVEPVLRRSALNQVSVMVEDPLLHQTFVDSNGIEIMKEIMKTALTDQNYNDYPDSIVPIVSILKNVCLYHLSVREQLSTNLNVFYYVLRGLFLYFTEDRMKQDAALLLFLLIFKDFIKGTPSLATFSLPEVICQNMHMPFQCNRHWKASDFTKENLRAAFISDRWCLSSIQIQWNSEIFGGFEELIKWDKINYEDHAMFNFVDELKLNNYDLKAIKASSVNYCLRHYLNAVQNGTSHSSVIESIDFLALYIYLYKISNSVNAGDECFLSLPWEQSFSRFIRSLPSCEEDVLLLRSVIQFFTILVPFYKSSEKECWIITILKDNSQCLLDLLSVDNTSDEDSKIISQELLNLVTVCVCQEQYYLDYYTPSFAKTSNKSWTHVIKMIANNLKFSDAQHFYNLAYLDALLQTMVHLTATLGWSESRPSSPPKEPMPQMISGLCELVGAFHCGKGPTAAVSLMGLSITRHVLLILNHLLAELQNSKAKGWEVYFFDDIDTGSLLRSFLALWASRDVILRAAALQFFSGLVVSPRAAIEIVSEVKIDNGNIWELAFTVVIDHTEASIVRENAVQLLANLVSHVAASPSNKISSSNAPPALKKNCTGQLLSLFEEYDFYRHLDTILSRLFTLNIANNALKCGHLEENKRASKGIFGSDQSWYSSSENSDTATTSITPCFVKSIGMFLYNMMNVASDEVANKLLEKGLVKLLFRTLCNPSMSVNSTTELSLYCDLLEMNTLICMLMTRLANSNLACLGTILHTNDCLNVMLSLLNYKIYHTHLPQLVYLRNKLWTEIFNLIAALIECSNSENKFNNRSVEVLTVFSRTLSELGNEPFIETICESISCLGSHELQNSALISLTSLLRIEVYRVFEKPKSTDESTFESSTLQTLLDSVRTPRSIIITETKENKENTIPISNKQKNLMLTAKALDRYKMSLLEEVYFEHVFPKRPDRDIPDDFEVSFIDNCDSLMAGAEICKILLYLYDIYDLKTDNKRQASVLAALSVLLSVSEEAKKYALRKGLAEIVIRQLKEFNIKLSLESVDCLRRVADKRRVCPVLKEVNDLVGLLTNFMVNNGAVKNEAASLNLADVIHKLWVWFLAQNVYLVDVLKMLSTFTTNCILACQSLTLTSPVAGSGPRKTPSNISLLHTIITLIVKEMDQVSKTHNLNALELSFNVLHNCCESLECRVLMSKSNLFQSILRLHPAITKRQKPWETIELIWLNFLQTFTAYPEGQASIAKVADLLDLTMTLTSSTRVQNRLTAMQVLRNLAFYQPNKLRLLNSGDFLHILQTKLTSGSKEEKNTVVVIMWALASNSQKAKIILKSAHLDAKLQNAIKYGQLLTDLDTKLSSDELEKMYYVLNMLRDSDKVR